MTPDDDSNPAMRPARSYVLAQMLWQSMPQPFVVGNCPGGDGMIAGAPPARARLRRLRATAAISLCRRRRLLRF